MANRQGLAMIPMIMGLLLFALLQIAPQSAFAQSSANYTLTTRVVDAAGPSMSSANYKLDSSLGEAFDGFTVSSANFTLKPDFQPTAHAAVAQAITFTSTPTAQFGDSGYTVSATGGASGNSVTFSVLAPGTAQCSMSTPTLVVYQSVGTCTIVADQAGNASYAAAPQVSQTLTVAQATQTISFTTPAPSSASVGGPTYTPAATATSGNAVIISVNPASSSICSIIGGVVSFTNTGTCTLNANQAGNTNYAAAAQVQQSFTVAPPAPNSLSWVSSSGNDANACTAAAPCATFAGALAKTVAGGTILVRDAGEYGPVTITKAITISGAGKDANITATSGSAITINAGDGDVVMLKGLNIQGTSSAAYGIQVLRGLQVYVQDCIIRDFTNTGVAMTSSTADARTFIQRGTLINNAYGIGVAGNGRILSVLDTLIDGSLNAGAVAMNGAILGMAGSTINASPISIQTSGGAEAVSVGPGNIVSGTGGFSRTIQYQ